MGWTDSHGRPELRMHPDIKRGVVSYRTEKPLGQTAPDTADGAAVDSSTAQPPKRVAGRRTGGGRS